MLLRRDRAGKLCELSAVFLALIWKVRGNPGSEKNKMTFNACKALHPGGKVFFFFSRDLVWCLWGFRCAQASPTGQVESAWFLEISRLLRNLGAPWGEIKIS